VLTILAIRTLTWTVKKTVKFINGGIGLRLTTPIWGTYWRYREYKADTYAAQLGQADELADFLETHALIHDYPIPYIWLTEHTHPPNRATHRQAQKPNPPRDSGPLRTCQGNPYGAAYGGS
jgi:Zn-dependent protease with chaperone function